LSTEAMRASSRPERRPASGECLLGAASTLLAAGILRDDDSFGQFLMHGNVVQAPMQAKLP